MNLKIKVVMMWIGVILFGFFFSWRLSETPTRAEAALFFALLFMAPSFIYPKVAYYYLLTVPAFVPMFRRLYYLVAGRPQWDYIMLITDGVLISMFIAIVMLWVKNKEKNKDFLSIFVFILIIILLLKVFVIQRSGVINGLYSFKYYGIYILFYFAGVYLVNGIKQFHKSFKIISWVLLIVALYSIKQVYLDYFYFEKIWVESIEFTTLFIEGHIRTFSTLVSPAALADAMSIGIILGLYFLFKEKFISKFWGLTLIVICIFPLLFATVRTNWIASLFSIWLFVYSYTQFKKLTTILNIVMLPLLIFFMINYGDNTSQDNTLKAQKNLNADNTSISSVMITNRTSAIVNPLEEYSLQKRILTWEMIIKDTWYRFPLGSGLGNVTYAHSLYVQLLGETGYFGIGIFLLILVVIGVRSVKLIRKIKDKQELLLVTSFFTIFVTVCILNITGNHLNAHPLDIIFWFSCGALSQFYTNHYKNDSETPLETDVSPTPFKPSHV